MLLKSRYRLFLELYDEYLSVFQCLASTAKESFHENKLLSGISIDIESTSISVATLGDVFKLRFRLRVNQEHHRGSIQLIHQKFEETEILRCWYFDRLGNIFDQFDGGNGLVLISDSSFFEIVMDQISLSYSELVHNESIESERNTQVEGKVDS